MLSCFSMRRYHSRALGVVLPSTIMWVIRAFFVRFSRHQSRCRIIGYNSDLWWGWWTQQIFHIGFEGHCLRCVCMGRTKATAYCLQFLKNLNTADKRQNNSKGFSDGVQGQGRKESEHHDVRYGTVAIIVDGGSVESSPYLSPATRDPKLSRFTWIYHYHFSK